jgi:pimeloyl-ACP methyl ester carboxylesterase
MSHEVTTIDVQGARTEILTRGSGSPLVYFHSAGGSFWSPFLDKLAERFSVFAPTLPGFGGSAGLERIDTIHDLVFHAVDVLDALGLERVPIVGLSLGGWLAAELAVHQARRVEKLVLLNAIGLRVDGAPVSEYFFLADPAEAREILFADPNSVTAKGVIPDEPSDELLSEVLKAREATARVAWNPYFHDPRLAERLYRVKAPTLVVWAAEDRLVPVAHGEAYARGIARAQLVVVPKTGHALPLEEPEETARIVTDFLAP